MWAEQRTHIVAGDECLGAQPLFCLQGVVERLSLILAGTAWADVQTRALFWVARGRAEGTDRGVVSLFEGAFALALALAFAIWAEPLRRAIRRTALPFAAHRAGWGRRWWLRRWLVAGRHWHRWHHRRRRLEGWWCERRCWQGWRGDESWEEWRRGGRWWRGRRHRPRWRRTRWRRGLRMGRKDSPVARRS
jgi:hypothetical protein